ncbi:MAG: anaerobic glycerol-3-phosphate dehydrogenase subunit C [Anaerolineales bacterium]|nr:anaerobic glycerol-3-phosphate dehydrogenase subunit C [Anaerolineales bacterium]
MSHQPVELTLNHCIKCNICVSACPVAAVNDLFPGPKYAGPQAGRFRKPGQSTPDYSVDYCSGCRVCNMACPNGVKIAEMNARARHTMVSQGKVPPIQRLRNNLIARTELLGNLAQPVAPLSNILLSNPLVRGLTEYMLGIAKDAYFPPFARQRFSRWWRGRKTSPLRPAPNGSWIGGEGKQVVFFHGCATEYYEPRVGRAAIHILEANGFEVIIPPQNCCGLPLLSNGEFEAARKYHQNNVNQLLEYARQGIPIVGTSTSCTLTLKEEAPELLDMYDADTHLVTESTYDFNEFLLNLLAADKLIIESLRPIPLRLAYHQPCQYRAHGLGSPAVEILHLIPELQIEESHADCCGIAGTYGYKKEKYATSMAVGQPLFDFVLEIEGPLAVCDSETCRWQITHGTGLPAIHPVELLAYAYGYETEGALADVLVKS